MLSYLTLYFTLPFARAPICVFATAAAAIAVVIRTYPTVYYIISISTIISIIDDAARTHAHKHNKRWLAGCVADVMFVTKPACLTACFRSTRDRRRRRQCVRGISLGNQTRAAARG